MLSNRPNHLGGAFKSVPPKKKEKKHCKPIIGGWKTEQLSPNFSHSRPSQTGGTLIKLRAVHMFDGGKVCAQIICPDGAETDTISAAAAGPNQT